MVERWWKGGEKMMEKGGGEVVERWCKDSGKMVEMLSSGGKMVGKCWKC